MGEFHGIGSCSDGVCECYPVNGVWVFLIALIFSQFMAPCVIYCRWSDEEGPQIRGGSLIPFKITLFLNLTSHFVSVKITLHPALHRTWMPMSEAIYNSGTICPVMIIGRSGILMSHMCVE